MKILFLCGSLEPGHDGVGDYTRTLAAEMIRTGHHVRAISLNDAYLDEELDCIQFYGDIQVPVLRLPARWPSRRRFREAKKWIDEFDPNWISLQFVIFSFQSKGLPIRLSYFLAKLGKGRYWHIMFHELWVGMPIGASLKHILWGWLQKKIILSIILRLKPEIINTQSWLYYAQLTKLGFNVSYLPLFSNIPVVDSIVENEEKTINGSRKNISMVVFGTIHPSTLIEQLLEEVITYKKKNNTEITLTIIGRCGPEQERWVSAWKSAGLKVQVLGEQSATTISHVLSCASVGIATCAIAMIDKSGTVAAMLKHGLPVLCVAKPWVSREIDILKPPHGIIELSKGGLDACMKSIPDIHYPDVSDISSTLIKQLYRKRYDPYLK
jgi:glycosyltransferase involved in cell wall biosynthesis